MGKWVKWILLAAFVGLVIYDQDLALALVGKAVEGLVSAVLIVLGAAGGAISRAWGGDMDQAANVLVWIGLLLFLVWLLFHGVVKMREKARVAFGPKPKDDKKKKKKGGDGH